MPSEKRLAAQVFAAENGNRPPVQIWGVRGMVSSMHPLASDAAVQTLRKGGNAIDAAVTLGAAIAVTNPEWSGLAGDSAWLIYLVQKKEFFYLDGYSTCPARMTSELLQKQFGLERASNPRAFQEEPPECRDEGVVVGMVPGTPAAWWELSKRFGSLPFRDLCAPAIQLAEEGLPINRYLSESISRFASKLLPYESTRRVVRKRGTVLLGEGDTLRQHDLAATLRRLAEGGDRGFYEGETADLLFNYCRQHDGLMTLEDLNQYKPVWRPVMRGNYRGTDVVVSTPPTAGVHVLQALNILEGFDLAKLGYHTVESLHVLIESLKLTLNDRRMTGGDPDFLAMNVERLVSKRYAEELRARITLKQVQIAGVGEFPGSSTTHFVVADGAGNLVCATQTVGSRFGCGEVIEGTGMFMNDRSWWMALDDGPNGVSPLHRASIGHAPTILLANNCPYAALGSPGGYGIVPYVVQTIVNMIDYGLDIQSAIEAPRFKIEDLGGQVGMEKRIARSTIRGLVSLGHDIFDYPEWTDQVGGVEGVYVDPATGHMLGGYDPRRNSMAAGVS